MDNATARITAFCGEDGPGSVEIEVFVPSRGEAEALAAQFPKSAGLKISNHSAAPDGNGGWNTTFAVRGYASLTSNDANGGRNEAGIKRYRAIAAKLDALGIALTVDPARWAGLVYESREAFEAAIG